MLWWGVDKVIYYVYVCRPDQFPFPHQLFLNIVVEIKKGENIFFSAFLFKKYIYEFLMDIKICFASTPSYLRVYMEISTVSVRSFLI